MNLPTLRERIHRLRLNRATGLLSYKEAFIKSVQYAEFLDQDTQLSDFVPCKDGVPMEKPKKFKKAPALSGRLAHDYQEARDNCKFIGWEIVEIYEKLVKVRRNKRWLVIVLGVIEVDTGRIPETIESLITAGINLKPTERVSKELKL